MLVQACCYQHKLLPFPDGNFQMFSIISHSLETKVITVDD